MYEGWDVHTVGKQKWRHIDNPLPQLKTLQKKINKQLLPRVPLPSDMFGAAPGSDLVDHARQHENARCVVTLDICDFFPSTTLNHIYDVFSSLLGMPHRWAAPLTKLTTRFCRLPQGAPTSSYLAHLALLPVRDEIASLCQKRGVRLTAYMDDLVFSGHRARELIEPTIRALGKHGFRVAQRKTKVMGADDARIITNIDVTKCVRAPEQYTSAVEAAILAFAGRGNIPKNERDSIAGKIKYVRRLCSSQADALEQLLREVPVVQGRTRRDSQVVWERCHCRQRCRWEKQRRHRSG
jgi:hypothetical protein